MLKSIVGFVLVIPIYIVFLIIGIKKKMSIFKHTIWLLFFIYIGLVVAVTLFPFPYDSEIIQLNREWQNLSNNFIPFKSISQLISTGNITTISRNILGNILLAAPFGFLIPILFENSRKIKNILFSGLFFSSIIEGSQFVLSLFLGYTYKVTDIDDIILNVIGSLFGYITFKLVCIIVKE